jgi:hypothetical protein
MDHDVVGAVGLLTVASRGADGLGEVQVRLRGGTELLLARSAGPLAKGTTVQIIADLGGRIVEVAAFPTVADPFPSPY